MDLPVVTEGDTLDEVVANVREAIALHLEGEDLGELGLSGAPSILASIEFQAGWAFARN
jgi:predicted RNase H-like HicB family nuclease